MTKYLFYLLACCLFLQAGCDNEIDVNAPARDIVVVYGVLDPNAPVQYIRVAKAYLTEGDAIQYAKEADLNLKNAVVRLEYAETLGGTVKKIDFTPYDTLKEDNGDFPRNLTLFRSFAAIKPGYTYKLIVDLGDGKADSKVEATTIVPDKPFIYDPDTCLVVGGNCQVKYDDSNFSPDQEHRRLFKFEQESASLAFAKTIKSNAGLKAGAGFELRIYFTYGDCNGGDKKTIRFGPTPIVSGGQSCKQSYPSSVSCIPFGRDFMTFVQQNIPSDGSACIDTSAMNQSVLFELTAMDKFLYDYIAVGNPDFTDFTTQKSEYTNIKTADGKSNAGIFGAINRDYRYVRTTQCFRYLMNLNDTPKPPSGVCE